jgi:hypothetical protein
MALFDKITDPLEMLCCVNEGEQWFGDNYYRDITNCIWKNVNRVINLSTEKERSSGNQDQGPSDDQQPFRTAQRCQKGFGPT